MHQKWKFNTKLNFKFFVIIFENYSEISQIIVMAVKNVRLANNTGELKRSFVSKLLVETSLKMGLVE